MIVEICIVIVTAVILIFTHLKSKEEMQVTDTERLLYKRVESLNNKIEENNETIEEKNEEIKELRRQLKHSQTQCRCK